MSSAVTAVVLRFRDLVTSPGETIALHRQRCDERGFTWWGWWNRSDEAVPYETFVRLKFMAVTSGGFKAFLLDTATDAIYEAHCTDLQFAAAPLTAQPSPQPDATPAYYSSQQYLAWFRFNSITPQPIEETQVVGRYSYAALAEPFGRSRKEDARFADKVVASIREMKRQGRTLFFLKNAAPTDATQEVFVKPRLQVFLCHSSGDKAHVRQLYERLKADGLAPWLDEENLLGGQQWEFAIKKAVRESDMVLVCLSASAVNKEGFLQKEIKYALDIAEEKPEDAIFIVPVRLEPCKVPQRLKHLQYIDLFASRGYEKIIASVSARADALAKSLDQIH